MRKLRSGLIVVLVGCVALCGCGKPKKTREKKTGGVPPTTPAVSISVPSIVSEGKTVSLEDAKDKVVLLNFWGTWDQPCCAELEVLNELYAEYKDRGFEIVGLVMDSSIDDNVAAVIKEHGLVFPNGVAADLLQTSPFDQVRVYPTKFFLNADHQLVGEALPGVVPAEELRQRIEELL